MRSVDVRFPRRHFTRLHLDFCVNNHDKLTLPGPVIGVFVRGKLGTVVFVFCHSNFVAQTTLGGRRGAAL